MDIFSLFGLALGLGFAAGINLYAVVLTLGLGAHLGLVQLPAHLDGLAALGHPSVVLLAAAGYLAQFLADKVRWLDSGWDVVHAAVRPAGAMLVVLPLVGQVDSLLAATAVALAGVAAASTHAAKAGVRLAINSVPEPLANLAVSLVEDGFVVVCTWIAVHHPALSGAVVAGLSLGLGTLAPWLARVAGVECRALGGLLRSLCARPAAERDPAGGLPVSHAALLAGPAAGAADADTRFALRCASAGGSGARRHDLGFLCLGGGELLFVTRQAGRVRGFPIDLSRLEEIRCRPGPALDRLTLRTGVEHAHFLVFKDGAARLESAVRRLQRAHAEARTAALRAARARAAANGHAVGDVAPVIRRNGGSPV
jgi:hypothetical protein